MAAVITTHCKLGVVDANGNVTMISIQSTGDDVTIIPNSIVSATTVQALVDSLKSSAFIANFMGINDSSTDGVNVTYSVKMINTKLAGLKSDIDEEISEINESLPFPLVIQSGVYGYKKLSGEFTAFKSQADIDSAVAAAKVGTAGQGQVLTGYTFTNSSTSGLNGSMPNNEAVNVSLNTGTTSYTVPAGYHNGNGKVSISTQTKSVTPTTSSQTVSPDSGKVLSSVTVGAIATQTKSVTPTTSSQTVTPDSGKYLSSVTVAAISTQTKSVTPTTSNQTVTPDSGKYLSSVSVGTQAHSGSYKPNANNAASDMGVTHNYRYVDTTAVYQIGYNAGNSDGYSRGQSDGYSSGFEAAKARIKVYEYTASSTESTDNTLQSTSHSLYINSSVLAGKWIISIGLSDASTGTSAAATTETRVWYNDNWGGASAENPAITVQWRDKDSAYHLNNHFTYTAQVKVVYFE